MEARIELNLSLSLGALLSKLKKSNSKDLQPGEVRALDAVIQKQFGAAKLSDSVARSLRKGVLTSHAIINDLVHAGLEPLRATDLLIACKCIIYRDDTPVAKDCQLGPIVVSTTEPCRRGPRIIGCRNWRG